MTIASHHMRSHYTTKAFGTSIRDRSTLGLEMGLDKGEEGVGDGMG